MVSGNGVSIVLLTNTKVSVQRCVGKDEITILARKHNDANIISLPARYIFWEVLAEEMVESFLTTDFEGETLCKGCKIDE